MFRCIQNFFTRATPLLSPFGGETARFPVPTVKLCDLLSTKGVDFGAISWIFSKITETKTACISDCGFF